MKTFFGEPPEGGFLVAFLKLKTFKQPPTLGVVVTAGRCLHMRILESWRQVGKSLVGFTWFSTGTTLRHLCSHKKKRKVLSLRQLPLKVPTAFF